MTVKSVSTRKPNTKSVVKVDTDGYWSQKIDDLVEKLGSSPNGLSQAAADRKLAEIGHNTLTTKSEVTPLGLLLNQFKSPIMLILIFATIASALLGDIVDAVIITLIVLAAPY